MLPGICAGFGARVDNWVPLSTLYDRNFRIYRQNILEPNGKNNFDQILAEANSFPHMEVLWLASVDHPETISMVPESSLFEYGNEPDLQYTPAEYAASLRYLIPIADERGIDLITGGISNLTPKAIQWLAEVLKRVPQIANIAFHRYPHGDNFETPHPGYSSRLAEWQALEAVIGTRVPWLTEFGYNTGVRKSGWWFWTKYKQWTDQQVAEMVTKEWQFWEDKVEAACIYQLNDGSSLTDDESNFGIRYTRTSGAWKPVADTIPKPEIDYPDLPLLEDDMILFTNTPIIPVTDLEVGEIIDSPYKAGMVAVKWGDGVLSINPPDFHFEIRHLDQIGPWESATRQGNKLIYNIAWDDDKGHHSVYVVLIIVGEGL